jgi:hypothetical protein
MRLIYILLITFHQCQGQTPNRSVVENQASSVYQYVQDSLPNYNFIVESKDEGKSLYMQQYKEQSLGCVSDFDGDKVDDYVLLLRDKNNKVCLFFFSTANNNVKHYLIDCFGIWKGEIKELKIAVEPKGKWEAIDETIKVPFDGIMVDDLKESRSKAYYWDKNKFTKFLYD